MTMLRFLKNAWREITRNRASEGFEQSMAAHLRKQGETAARLRRHGFRLLSSTAFNGLTFWKNDEKVCLTADEAAALADILDE